MKYLVSGTLTVGVSFLVESDDEDAAFDCEFRLTPNADKSLTLEGRDVDRLSVAWANMGFGFDNVEVEPA